jgi:hypothetical protein
MFVEVMGVDSEGDFAVSSHQLSINADDSTVHPKGEVDLQYKGEITTALEDAGYILEES